MKRNIRIALALFINCSVIIAQGTKTINNQLLWGSGIFYPENVYGVESMNDGLHFTQMDANRVTKTTTIDKYAYKTYKKVATVLSSSDLTYSGKKLTIDSYEFNKDETKILIGTEQESIYRHSNQSYYYIYDIKSQMVSPLSDVTLGKQRLAEFSPDGTMIAFVRKNNLFVKNMSTGEEKAITTDGETNKIINGATDWVYEEEFSFHKGWQWSPSSKKIAFYKFDESQVKEYEMELYGSLYPSKYKFKYPKAGEDNSIVSIHVYHVQSGRIKNFELGQNKDIYIPRISWTNKGDVLCIQRMNRLQNKLELLVAGFGIERQMGVPVKPRIVYTEESATYIDVHDNISFTATDNKILWTSEKDGFNHLYWIDFQSGETTQITKGDWEVTDVYGYDEASNRIYFQAAKNSPTQREVYSSKSDGSDLQVLSTQVGTSRAEFSDSYDYFLLYHSDANTPYTVSIHNTTKKKKAPLVIVDNDRLKNTMKEFDLTQQKFFTIKNAEGLDLNAWMIRPSNFSESKKYPVLMYVYGGPGINTVKDDWGWFNYFWFQSLAQKGYIVVSVDARGTGYRGRDFKHATYLQLGKKETEDQIATAKALGKMPFIDEERIGIFGWSYGGYMSSLCITKGADVFKSAIAVAPVTNWRYYDNIYTERFMRTPQENGENYDSNSPINHIDNLKGNYLLIHGSADDNVHFQNAMEMNAALVRANKPFEFMAYPNKNHSISGGPTRIHLYDKMTNFILENL